MSGACFLLIGRKLCTLRGSASSHTSCWPDPNVGTRLGPSPHPLALSLHSPDPVEAGEEVKVRVDLLPRHVGRHKLVVNFESDKLKAVKGFRNVLIGPA